MPQRDANGLQLEDRHRQVLQALLATHVPDAEVWAFGSRVTGIAHEGSDLDLVLRNPGHLQQDVSGCTALMQALQDSALPMLVEAHQWARLPESFHRNIEAAYVVLQAGR